MRRITLDPALKVTSCTVTALKVGARLAQAVSQSVDAFGVGKSAGIDLVDDVAVIASRAEFGHQIPGVLIAATWEKMLVQG